MKRKLSLLIVFMIVLSLVVSGCSKETPVTENGSDTSETTERITIRLGHSASETNIYQVVAEAFRDKVVELLGEERVEVKIYPNASLGSQTEMIEALQMGTLECVAFGRHSQIDSRLDVLNLPFLFEDTEHMTKVLRGEEGKAIREEIANMFEAKGIILLGMFEAGFRNITSSKKIASLDDLKDMVMRTPNTPVLMDSFSAWGANPTPIDFGELYTALQTKVVDGQENPYQIIYTNKYYEVNKYLCITNHSTICDQLQFSKVIWDKYPEDVKMALVEAGEYACNVAGEENNRRNATLLKDLSELMEVTEMPEDEINKMRSIAIERVYPKYTQDEISAKLVKDVQALGTK